MDESAIKEISRMAITGRAIPADFTDFPGILVPQGVSVMHLENLQQGRYRLRGIMSTNSIDSFVDFVKQQEEQQVNTFIHADGMEATTFFNLGTLASPGHADHRACLELTETAPFKELKRAGFERDTLKQRHFAEWLEDWREFLEVYTGDALPGDDGAKPIDIRKVVTAVRNIKIKSGVTSESAVQDYSAKKNLMAGVSAESKDLPAVICFRCEPYNGLSPREFYLRVSMLTDHDDPRFRLRLVQFERAKEDMAMEFRDALSSQLPGHIFLGSFAP